MVAPDRRAPNLRQCGDGRGSTAGPLLVLDRVGEGACVALLASDHAWLWNRGYEGGGPQLELLRRLAHWMMKEPELEEEALNATAIGQVMRIQRRTLQETVPDVTITGPDGSVTLVPMEKTAPGTSESTFTGPEIGLYRLENGGGAQRDRPWPRGPTRVRGNHRNRRRDGTADRRHKRGHLAA